MQDKYIELLLNKCVDRNESKILFIHYMKEIETFIQKLSQRAKELGFEEIYFDVEDNYIKDVYFNGEACAISTSATSIMLKNLVNKSVDEARLLIENYKKMINEEEYDEDLLKDLVVYDDIYLQPNRKTCALLPAKAVDKLLNSLK